MLHNGGNAVACAAAAAACRDKPRLISDGEKMASLYNIACCHSQLQDARSGLVALSGKQQLQVSSGISCSDSNPQLLSCPILVAHNL
jgi:hypothetical protein